MHISPCFYLTFAVSPSIHLHSWIAHRVPGSQNLIAQLRIIHRPSLWRSWSARIPKAGKSEKSDEFTCCGLDIEEIPDDLCQRLWVILVHHMARITDCDKLFVPEGVDALLFVRPFALMTNLPFDDENGALDAAQELDGLCRVEGLR